ncbi:MAG: hypothetical protein GY803_24945 [Chloroflexi bacterium]|nr:hypothetical protein [Chloroflexota bacterium]
MFAGKIFGIGFHKTGTSSLARALDLLGYKVTGSFGLMDTDIAETVYQQAYRIVPEFDAFQDNPWPVIYRELDERFPGSKFILTLRPTRKWLDSAVAHFGDRSTPMRAWIYGVGDPRGNEVVYQERYDRHNADVMAYFDNRSDGFLTIRITEGEGWEKLCPFLNVESPNAPFPHTNSMEDRHRLMNRLKRGAKKLAYTLSPYINKVN